MLSGVNVSSIHSIFQTFVVDKRAKKLSPGRVGHCGTLSGIMEQGFSFVCIRASICNVARKWRPEITFVGCPSLSAIQTVHQKWSSLTLTKIWRRMFEELQLVQLVSFHLTSRPSRLHFLKNFPQHPMSHNTRNHSIL